MTSLKKIAIVGAAGNLGRYILQALIDSDYDVTVISRAESTSKFQGVPEQNVIKGEYTTEFFRKALSGQDALVLAIGSGVLSTQKEIIDAAIEVGVKRIIPSEFGSDISDPASLKALPFNEEKKLIADYLTKAVSASPLTTWTSIVSGPFFDWCLEYGLFGCDIKTHQATLYDSGKTRFDATNISTVGEAVAKVLSMPEQFQNERVLISGMAITQSEILDALKKATGSEDWVVTDRTSESLRHEGNSKMANNDFSGILDIIGASLFQAGQGSHYSLNGKVMNDLLGVKDDLYESVDKYVKSQSGKD